jgi:hypothetical protein
MWPSSASPPPLSPDKALLTARIVWGALILGVAMIGVVFTLVLPRSTAGGDPTLLVPVVFFLVLTAIPIGLFMRGQVFKKHWVGDVVTPRGYIAGNIIAWASCEGTALFSLIVAAFIPGSTLALIPGAIAFVTLVLLFPNGKAMFPPGVDNPYQQRR